MLNSATNCVRSFKVYIYLFKIVRIIVLKIGLSSNKGKSNEQICFKMNFKQISRFSKCHCLSFITFSGNYYNNSYQLINVISAIDFVHSYDIFSLLTKKDIMFFSEVLIANLNQSLTNGEH